MDKIHLELKFWKVTSLPYKLATQKPFLKMEKVFRSFPVVKPNYNSDCVTLWHKLGPIKIADIVKNSKINVDTLDFKNIGFRHFDN